MKPAVMIVDDSLTVRMDLDDAFASSGFRTELCSDASAARRALAAGRFDLIVLDVLMDDEDGLALLRDLRKQAATASVPVVLLSAEAEVSDRIRGLAIGATDYVGKPSAPRRRGLAAHALHPAHRRRGRGGRAAGAGGRRRRLRAQGRGDRGRPRAPAGAPALRAARASARGAERPRPQAHPGRGRQPDLPGGADDPAARGRGRGGERLVERGGAAPAGGAGGRLHPHGPGDARHVGAGSLSGHQGQPVPPGHPPHHRHGARRARRVDPVHGGRGGRLRREVEPLPGVARACAGAAAAGAVRAREPRPLRPRALRAGGGDPGDGPRRLLRRRRRGEDRLRERLRARARGPLARRGDGRLALGRGLPPRGAGVPGAARADPRRAQAVPVPGAAPLARGALVRGAGLPARARPSRRASRRCTGARAASASGSRW